MKGQGWIQVLVFGPERFLIARWSYGDELARQFSEPDSSDCRSTFTLENTHSSSFPRKSKSQTPLDGGVFYGCIEISVASQKQR
eukprot:1616330-Amphidinium_carterae.1